jgi:hypothetical protein
MILLSFELLSLSAKCQSPKCLNFSYFDLSVEQSNLSNMTKVQRYSCNFEKVDVQAKDLDSFLSLRLLQSKFENES